MKTLYSLLLFIILVFFEPLAYAESKAIGQVVWVSGSVQAVSSSQGSRALQRRSPIYEYDSIVTGASGSGQIVFTDDSVVSLRAGTTFKIDQYKFNPSSPNSGKYVASIAKGGFRTVTGLISKGNPDGYQVNTPVATIGVRGTDYSIFYSSATGLDIKLSKGKIFVGNRAGSVLLDAAQNRAYAAIRDIRHPPAVTSKPSPVFRGQPAVTAVPPGAASGDPGAGVVTPIGGPAKKVSGFCIE